MIFRDLSPEWAAYCRETILRAEHLLATLTDPPSIVLLEANIAAARTALREGNREAQRIETNNLRRWIAETEIA